jgi:hypothetical protein
MNRRSFCRRLASIRLLPFRWRSSAISTQAAARVTGSPARRARPSEPAWPTPERWEKLKLAFPPRYHYDVLRALDYFRDADVQPDARISDAVHLIESRRQPDGRWLLDRAYEEALPFPFGESVGEPSRWNTLRAPRVLRWCDRRGPQPTSTP